MMLSGVLFVLFLTGCWLYCLTDAVLTPASEYRGLPKPAWIGIIGATFIAGAIAWLVTRRSWRTRAWAANRLDRTALAGPGEGARTWIAHWTAADDTIARHPASRARRPSPGRMAAPKGPDDDPGFLRQLDHRIHGTSADAGE